MTTTPRQPYRWLPTSTELRQAPELAVLAALDAFLEITAGVLHAAHPEINADPECPYWIVAADRITAEILLQLFEDLRLLLARYRDETLSPTGTLDGRLYHDEPPGAAPSDHDIPF
jgi:hypothetical protein